MCVLNRDTDVDALQFDVAQKNIREQPRTDNYDRERSPEIQCKRTELSHTHLIILNI